MAESEKLKVVEAIASREASKRDNRFEEISESLPVFAQRVAAQPERRMLIENLIPEGTTLIHGQPRALKTFFVQECLIAITTKTPAFGWDAFTVCDPLPVWYVSDEDSERDVLMRFEGLCRGRGISCLPDNLRLSVWKGLSLDSPEGQARIIETVRRHGIQVVAFDPLRSVTSNTDDGPGKFNVPAQFLRQLRRETGCPSIWLVHHDVKPSNNGRESRDRPQRASGGGIFAFCDAPIHLERLNDVLSQAGVTPSHYKFMSCPSPFTFTLDVSDSNVFRLVGSHNVTAARNRRNHRRSRIIQCATANPGFSKNQIVETVGGNKQDVLSEISALEVARVLGRDENGWTVGNAAT
jgi:hypothetical protein